MHHVGGDTVSDGYRSVAATGVQQGAGHRARLLLPFIGMRVSWLRLFAMSGAIVVGALGTIAPVRAHGGESGIDVAPAQVSAGGQVTVFGEDLEPSTLMALHLLTAEGDELVGEPMTDEVGHFSLPLSLPGDLAERVYELRLTAPSGESSSTFVTIIRAEAADGGAGASPNTGTGLIIAGALALASIGLLVLALRPRRT